ncbi:MAG: hypothetical protein H6834_17710, partial [Planctomycetes bacterium]|nr:hypothetical protein [Planctomycetota bacterium]
MFEDLVPDPEAIPDPHGRLRPWLLLVLVLAVLPLTPGLDIGFLSDDFPHVARMGTARDAFADFARPQYGLDSPRFYRPLVSVSLWATGALFGPHPMAYRVANVVLHLIGVAALVGLAWRLGLDARAAALAGLLYAWFPYAGGNVLWIVGRVDSFAVPLCLVTLWAYVRARGFQPWRPSRRDQFLSSPRWAMPLAVAAFVLALLTKEIALATLPILLALEIALGRGVLGLRRTLPFVLVALVYLVLRRFALGSFVGGYAGGQGALPGEGDLLGRCAGLLHTYWNLLVPWFLERGSLGVALRSLPVLAIGVLFLLGWERGGRVRRRAVFAVVWVLCASLPLYQMWGENLATNERTYHFAWAGVALFIAGVVLPEGGWRKEAFPAFLTAVLLASCLCGLWRNVEDHVAASRQVETLQREVANARARGEGELFVVRDVPRAVGSAYALNFGLREAFRPPFADAASEVLVYRKVFPAAPELAPLPLTLRDRLLGAEGGTSSIAPRQLLVLGMEGDDVVL